MDLPDRRRGIARLKFISRLIGASNGTTISNANRKIIRADLSRLNQFEARIGAKALEFVMSGDGGSVLSTHSTRQPTPIT